MAGAMKNVMKPQASSQKTGERSASPIAKPEASAAAAPVFALRRPLDVEAEVGGAVVHQQQGEEAVHGQHQAGRHRHHRLPAPPLLDHREREHRDAAEAEADGEQAERHLAAAREPARDQPAVGHGEDQRARDARHGPAEAELPQLGGPRGRQQRGGGEDAAGQHRLARPARVHPAPRQRADEGGDQRADHEGRHHRRALRLPARVEVPRDRRDVDRDRPEQRGDRHHRGDDPQQQDHPAVVDRAAQRERASQETCPREGGAEARRASTAAMRRSSISAIVKR